MAFEELTTLFYIFILYFIILCSWNLPTQIIGQFYNYMLNPFSMKVIIFVFITTVSFEEF